MTREEAIKIVKEFISGMCLHLTDQEAFETLIPELTESEDERIRKELIEFIQWSVDRHFMREDFHQAKRPSEQKEPHYTKRNALFDKCVENCDPKTVEEVNKRVDDIMNMHELSPFEQALTNFIGDWENGEEHWPSQFVKKHGKHILDMAREELQEEQKPAECHKDALIEWAKHALKCQEEELAKYDGPCYGKASTMGRIDAYKVLISKLNSL